jgi:uncharacterized protein YjaG (DUF416 family)
MKEDTIQQIHKAIHTISFIQKLAFAYLMAKRLYPNYIKFYEKEKWGNPEIVNKSIHTLEEIILSGKAELLQKDLVNDLHKITPDTEDFNTFLTSLALDVCSILLETFSFIESKDDSAIISISNSSLDLTQMHIELRDHKSCSDYSYNDPLIQEELNFQLSILKHLEKNIEPSKFLDVVVHTSKLGELV